MRANITFGLFFISLLVLISVVIADDVADPALATYDFDEIDVTYSAQFDAIPVRIESGSWAVDNLAGADEPISVLYGVVDLKKNGEVTMSEEFIRVEGDNGFRRFLLNGGSYDYYDNGNVKEMKSFFWSAKVIQGNAVIKDKSLRIDSVALHRSFAQDGTLESAYLTFSNDGENHDYRNDLFEEYPTLYDVDLNSLTEGGGGDDSNDTVVDTTSYLLTNSGVSMRGNLIYPPSSAIPRVYDDVEDLCALSAGDIAAVYKYDNGWVGYVCGSNNGNFNLVKGEGYHLGINPPYNRTLIVELEGYQEEGIVVNLLNLSAISNVTHLSEMMLPASYANKDTSDICAAVNDLVLISQWSENNGRYSWGSYICDFAFGIPNVDVSKTVFFEVKGDQQWQTQ